MTISKPHFHFLVSPSGHNLLGDSSPSLAGHWELSGTCRATAECMYVPRPPLSLTLPRRFLPLTLSRSTLHFSVQVLATSSQWCMKPIKALRNSYSITISTNTGERNRSFRRIERGRTIPHYGLDWDCSPNHDRRSQQSRASKPTSYLHPLLIDAYPLFHYYVLVIVDRFCSHSSVKTQTTVVPHIYILV